MAGGRTQRDGEVFLEGKKRREGDFSARDRESFHRGERREERNLREHEGESLRGSAEQGIVFAGILMQAQEKRRS